MNINFFITLGWDDIFTLRRSNYYNRRTSNYIARFSNSSENRNTRITVLLIIELYIYESKWPIIFNENPISHKQLTFSQTLNGHRTSSIYSKLIFTRKRSCSESLHILHSFWSIRFCSIIHLTLNMSRNFALIYGLLDN